MIKSLEKYIVYYKNSFLVPEIRESIKLGCEVCIWFDIKYNNQCLQEEHVPVRCLNINWKSYKITGCQNYVSPCVDE